MQEKEGLYFFDLKRKKTAKGGEKAVFFLLLLLHYLYKIQKKMSIEFFAFIAFFRKL